METKNIITNYRDAVKPMTRTDIAQYLIAADSQRVLLTSVEKDELTFFMQEFFAELKQLHYNNVLPEERWHLYTYNSDIASLHFDLIGGYSIDKGAEGKNFHIRSNGAQGYGYLGNFSGIYFSLRDNQEGGSRFDQGKTFTPSNGQVVARSLNDFFEYDPYDVQVNFDISFLRLSIEKSHNVWGSGERGNVILSTKAPSFPQIKLHVKLGKEMTFTYLHGWLSSGIIDSLNSYTVANIPGSTGFRKIYKQKFIAAHILEISLWKGVDIALGESEVYGGRGPEILYLIPIMFFKAGEHYSDDTDNSQFFGNIDLSLIKNHNMYLSLFIDEFSTEEFYRTDRQRNQLGFTVGTHSYDLLFPNTHLNIEYTRINPWAYNHKFPDATYQSHGYNLGHWIGQNADLFFAGADYRPMRNLKVGAQFESVRKGGKMPTHFQYELPTPEFLYGPLIKNQSYGINARYEPLRDLFIDMNALITSYSQESDVPGVFQFPRVSSDYSRQFDFYLALRYNFQ